MARTATVRYLVPVYVTVDLDATKAGGAVDYPDGSVRNVFVADEETYLAEDYSLRLLGLSYEDIEKALDVAEHALWPGWRYD